MWQKSTFVKNNLAMKKIEILKPELDIILKDNGLKLNKENKEAFFNSITQLLNTKYNTADSEKIRVKQASHAKNLYNKKLADTELKIHSTYKMYGGDLTIKFIADEIGKSQNTVRNFLLRSAIKNKAKPELLIPKYLNKNIEKILDLTFGSKEDKKYVAEIERKINQFCKEWYIPNNFLFPYQGSKKDFKKILETHIRNIIHKKHYTQYVEIFAGGLGVYLSFFEALGFENHIQHVVLNDTNNNLIQLYKHLANREDVIVVAKAYIQAEEDYQSILNTVSTTIEKKKLPSAKSYYNEIKAKFNNVNTDIKTKSGYLIFLLNRCFGGLYKGNKKGDFTQTFGELVQKFGSNEKQELANTLATILEAFTSVNITFDNKSFEKIDYSNKQCLYYADPPYLKDQYSNINDDKEKVSKQYETVFTHKQQRELIDLLSQTSFLYSNHYNQSLIEYLKLKVPNIQYIKLLRKDRTKNKRGHVAEILAWHIHEEVKDRVYFEDELMERIRIMGERFNHEHGHYPIIE